LKDEPKTGDYLHKGLQESGFGAERARNELDGLDIAL
jgi:two-component system copper resistance phosphate regulon response regulator CusR